MFITFYDSHYLVSISNKNSISCMWLN